MAGIVRPRATVEIETDGTAAGTVVRIDGRELGRLSEFTLSVQAGGNVKVQGVRHDVTSGIWEPFSFYGGDFEKVARRRREVDPAPRAFIGCAVARPPAGAGAVNGG